MNHDNFNPTKKRETMYDIYKGLNELIITYNYIYRDLSNIVNKLDNFGISQDVAKIDIDVKKVVVNGNDIINQFNANLLQLEQITHDIREKISRIEEIFD